MKSYKYYLKSSDKLFAITRYKDLADEFESIYDMTKFYKMIDDWDSDKEYSKATRIYSKYKLWLYNVNTKDHDKNIPEISLSICMTEDMHQMIEKGAKNIRYSYKSAYISYLKLKEVEGIPISDKYLDALYSIAYDDNHILIDEYKIWTDVFADIIRISSNSNEALDTSIASARILGVYKYEDMDYSSIYPDITRTIEFPNSS